MHIAALAGSGFNDVIAVANILRPENRNIRNRLIMCSGSIVSSEGKTAQPDSWLTIYNNWLIIVTYRLHDDDNRIKAFADKLRVSF